MEDREALDKHMKKLTEELVWLRNSVAHVPRGTHGSEHGGGALRKPTRRKLHIHARSEFHASYKGQRAQVTDSRTPWEVQWPAYEPIEFTHSTVAARPFWADPPDADEVDFEYRISFEGPIICSPIGRPLNPRGRTGTSGRGLMGKWGPNHAADPIVLRRKPPPAEGEPPHDVTGVPGGVLFQMVAIKRSDTLQWAIPGGMVDDGELVSETLRREFTEEAGALEDPAAREDFEDQLDKIFHDGGKQIYRGAPPARGHAVRLGFATARARAKGCPATGMAVRCVVHNCVPARGETGVGERRAGGMDEGCDEDGTSERANERTTLSNANGSY
jgi:ADP-ribose pyrophosphatase